MSAPELRAPGQAGPGADLPSGEGHGVRAVLAELFPPPAGPGPRAGATRWAFVLVQPAGIAAGALVMLARYGGRPAWDSVWAEDPGIYLPQALAHPWHLLQSYGGYLQLVPRVIGQVAALLPVRYASTVFAASGAVVASACGLFAYHASAGHVGWRWLRGLLGLSVVLLPVAQLEIADNGVIPSGTCWPPCSGQRCGGHAPGRARQPPRSWCPGGCVSTPQPPAGRSAACCRCWSSRPATCPGSGLTIRATRCCTTGTRCFCRRLAGTFPGTFAISWG